MNPELTISEEEEEEKEENVAVPPKTIPNLTPCLRNFCDYFVVCGLNYDEPLEYFTPPPRQEAEGGGLFKKKDKGIKNT